MQSAATQPRLAHVRTRRSARSGTRACAPRARGARAPQHMTIISRNAPLAAARRCEVAAVGCCCCCCCCRCCCCCCCCVGRVGNNGGGVVVLTVVARWRCGGGSGAGNLWQSPRHVSRTRVRRGDVEYCYPTVVVYALCARRYRFVSIAAYVVLLRAPDDDYSTPRSSESITRPARFVLLLLQLIIILYDYSDSVALTLTVSTNLRDSKARKYYITL